MNNLTKWIPNNNVPDPLYIVKTYDDGQSLIFYFKDESKKMLLNFIFDSKKVLSFRSTYETSFMKTYGNIKQHYGKDYLNDWALYKIDNSNYLKWIREESLGILDEIKIDHYIIFAYDVVSEIISIEEPKVEIICNGIAS